MLLSRKEKLMIGDCSFCLIAWYLYILLSNRHLCRLF